MVERAGAEPGGAPARGEPEPRTFQGHGRLGRDRSEPEITRAQPRLGRPAVARGILDDRWRTGRKPGVRPMGGYQRPLSSLPRAGQEVSGSGGKKGAPAARYGEAR